MCSSLLPLELYKAYCLQSRENALKAAIVQIEIYFIQKCPEHPGGNKHLSMHTNCELYLKLNPHIKICIAEPPTGSHCSSE